MKQKPNKGDLSLRGEVRILTHHIDKLLEDSSQFEDRIANLQNEFVESQEVFNTSTDIMINVFLDMLYENRGSDATTRDSLKLKFEELQKKWISNIYGAK